MNNSNPRELKEMLRFAMENSDNTKPTEMDPERSQWLQQAMSAVSVDLTKQLKEDIQLLADLLPNANDQGEQLETVLEDILTLTEDLDLANDFFKLGGGDLLFKLVRDGPKIVKSQSYELLAHVTQNNPEAQKICVQQNMLPALINLLPKEKNLIHLKKLLLALSCLTRAYAPAVAEFRKADGFTVVLSVLSNFAGDAAAKPICDKGAFFIFCLLQEVIDSSLSEFYSSPNVLSALSLSSLSLGCTNVMLNCPVACEQLA
ncbi:unnamed protein product [Echinostoma caproni]|uniref:Fes1 domain-containing protein n=1 Tax=Echinostoma caproni TaxID=27848 RepID=A0A183B9K0_9TREM|nr:unnamed protein product [Echinostoma caproni]